MWIGKRGREGISVPRSCEGGVAGLQSQGKNPGDQLLLPVGQRDGDGREKD